MKKIFSLFAAVLFAGSMMAANLTCAEAIAKIDASDFGPYTVEGYVISIVETCQGQYGNTSVWMADDASATKGTFEAYRIPVNINEPDSIPVPGDKIAVTATLKKYYMMALKSLTYVMDVVKK